LCADAEHTGRGNQRTLANLCGLGGGLDLRGADVAAASIAEVPPIPTTGPKTQIPEKFASISAGDG